MVVCALGFDFLAAISYSHLETEMDLHKASVSVWNFSCWISDISCRRKLEGIRRHVFLTSSSFQVSVIIPTETMIAIIFITNWLDTTNINNTMSEDTNDQVMIGFVFESHWLSWNVQVLLNALRKLRATSKTILDPFNTQLKTTPERKEQCLFICEQFILHQITYY